MGRDLEAPQGPVRPEIGVIAAMHRLPPPDALLPVDRRRAAGELLHGQRVPPQPHDERAALRPLGGETCARAERHGQTDRCDVRAHPRLRHCLVSSTQARVFSHSSFSTAPPPEPRGSTVMVNCSTGWASFSTFMSSRTRSWAASYRVPHCPVCLLMMSFHPEADGSVHRV